MRRILYVVIAAFMASALCGCGQSLMSFEQESQAVWEVKKRVENALNSGDAKTLRSMFAEDPVFVICNGPVVEGLEAIEKMHMDFFRENPRFKTEFKRQHISFPTRDVAIETVSFIDRFPGQPLRYGGDTTVYVKEGGQWKNKYIRMHTSVPMSSKDQAVVLPHQFELVPMDDPEKVSEGIYQVGWIRASLPGDESHVQMIPVQMDEPDNNWPQWGLNRQDVNFDGYLDIGVCQHGGAKWGRFHWYLYDPDKKEFYTNALTNELSELTCAYFKADLTTKTIKRRQFIGAEIKEYTYEIVNGHLRLQDPRRK
jgi:uncharacterized protein (TIGR02246 family)